MAHVVPDDTEPVGVPELIRKAVETTDPDLATGYLTRAARLTAPADDTNHPST